MLSWSERIPKVELHLHLEGAIPLEILWQLVEKYGGDPTTPNRTALHEAFRYRDFTHFLELWSWKNRFLREYDDFSLVAEGVARGLAEQNVLYAEAFFSPAEFAEAGLQVGRVSEAIRRGLDRVDTVRVALIADLVRDLGPERGARTVEEVGELRDLGVIGIGLGGSEHRFPPEPYAAAFERARKLGLHTTAHAGEAAGPESIWGVLRALQVERIGHGVRAKEDPALIAHLHHDQVALEMCPVSNLRTGVVPCIEQHPVREYFDAGLLLTIGSDDPTLFGTRLSDEYGLLETSLGFRREELRRLVLGGVQASWLAGDEKDALLQQMERHPAWSERE